MSNDYTIVSGKPLSIPQRPAAMNYNLSSQLAGSCSLRCIRMCLLLSSTYTAFNLQFAFAAVAMASTKRRRISDGQLTSLQSLLHTGGITVGGLSTLLTTLRRQGMPEVTSTHYAREANMDLFMSLRRVIPMPLESGGGTCDWELADPNLLLSVALERCAQLNHLFAEAIARKPPKLNDPWRLVIGFDAFMPGDTVHGRETQLW